MHLVLMQKASLDLSGTEVAGGYLKVDLNTGGGGGGGGRGGRGGRDGGRGGGRFDRGRGRGGFGGRDGGRGMPHSPTLCPSCVQTPFEHLHGIIGVAFFRQSVQLCASDCLIINMHIHASNASSRTGKMTRVKAGSAFIGGQQTQVVR